MAVIAKCNNFVKHLEFSHIFIYLNFHCGSVQKQNSKNGICPNT